MPHIKISEQAKDDLGRFADFLAKVEAPHKVSEAMLTIHSAFKTLSSNPFIGREYPIDGYNCFRELVIKHGKSGYVALYFFDKEADLVTIHAIRHQKEVGYTHE